MNVDDFIYRNIGFEQTENIRKSISSVIGYLKDNNFIDSEIERVLLSFKDIEDICVDNLPGYLWNDSLLQKGIFYYHKEFHITSKSSYFDFEHEKVITERFFLEMKIKYTYEDILNYFYSKNNFYYLKDTVDLNKDIGSIKYLLNKYAKHDFIEPIDFLMFTIDEAVYDYKNNFVYYDKILDIDSVQHKVLDKLTRKVSAAKAEKRNKIVWR